MTDKMNKNKKYRLGKKQKLVLMLLLIPIIISAIIILSNINKKIYIDEKLYTTSQLKEMFLQDAKKIELKVSNLLLDGSVTDQNSLDKKVEKINNWLKKDNWKKLDLVNIDRWNGIWFLDKNGMIKFKFASKEIEPNWIKDNEVAVYIVEN